MAKQYRAFLDESGQREYGPQTDRYYVVAGVIAYVPRVKAYEDELRGLKRSFFGSPEVELKSNWLRRPEQSKQKYLDEYGIHRARLNGFVEALYRWIAATKLTLIAGVIDKHQMKEDYGANAHHPSALGYQVFLQRYEKFLGVRRGTGTVTCDELSGKSIAGNAWKALLQRQHKKLLKNGCNYTGTKFSRLRGDLEFVASECTELVQVADIVAYNTFRQFRNHGKIWDDPNADDLPLYDYFDRILPRFDKGSGSVFSGFGVAKMPRRHANQWLIT